MLGDVRIATMAAAALIGLSLCLGARAQSVTLGQFQHPKSAKDLEVNRTYLLGAAEALLAYNASRGTEAVLPAGPGAEIDVRRGERSGLTLGAQDQRLDGYIVGARPVVRPESRPSLPLNGRGDAIQSISIIVSGRATVSSDLRSASTPHFHAMRPPAIISAAPSRL